MSHFRNAIISSVVVLLGCVAFSSLPATSAPTPVATTEGGSHQLNALQGCMNQWLFNGIWRVRVKSVAPIVDDLGRPGYGLTVEFRNGSNKTTDLNTTGVPQQPGHLILDDGNSLDATEATAIVAWNNVYFKKLPASAGLTTTINFYLADKMATVPKPTKWILDIDPTKALSPTPRYTTKDPSLRVDLTCNKSGS